MSHFAKPPVMWFKMEKYHRFGNKYLVVMKELVITLFDKHNVEGIYFNVEFIFSECKAKNPLNKQQIIGILENIETNLGPENL
tara:strand:- start:295 stop:543 length:249 start_codon:yes stop_codon:yes gene_type:complete